MRFKLIMVSEHNGRETFYYSTREEAEAAQARIEEHARDLDDGVERTFKIEEATSETE